MSFSGKATYSAGATLPELAQDVSDIIGIVSPFETPLLDHLGDPQRAATSTIHEWLEDTLLPNTDAVDDQTLTNPTTLTTSPSSMATASRSATRSNFRARPKSCWSPASAATI